MAINAFILLNCASLVFLIYALVNFWNEWQGYKSSIRSALHPDEKNSGGRMAVISAAHIFSKNPNSVIPFPAVGRQIGLSLERKKGRAKSIELRGRGVSELRASRGVNYERYRS